MRNGSKLSSPPLKKNQVLLRLIDANLNRCREGLRVLEDTSRFFWKDEDLFKNFRKERHTIDLCTRKMYPNLLLYRDTGGDSGRRVVETSKRNFKTVVISNIKRCEESLRVLEEYGKIFSVTAARRFKKARFKIYDLEKRIAIRKLNQN